VADFTTAIALYPTHATTYEHRRYARFYSGYFKDAAADVTRELEFANITAYPMLFLFLARSKAGEDATAELQARAARLNSEEWPYRVIELLFGKGSTDAVLAGSRNQVEQCQAQFYVGEWYLLNGKQADGVAALHRAVETCPKARIEYDAAVAEVKRLRVAVTVR
jgi:lipoprotein NlpI